MGVRSSAFHSYCSCKLWCSLTLSQTQAQHLIAGSVWVLLWVCGRLAFRRLARGQRQSKGLVRCCTQRQPPKAARCSR